MKTSLESLKTTGIATMPYPPELRRKVADAAKAWELFVTLPQETKERLGDNNSITSVGYEIKHGIGPNADRKENFDMSGNVTKQLHDAIAAFHDPVAEAFVSNAADITTELASLAVRFGEQAESELHLDGLARRIQAGDVFLRFLHYFGNRQTGNLIAEPHTDNSGFTFHLFETDSGCQRLDQHTREWVDMPVDTGETIVFPAMQLQLVSKNELYALPHRVIATDKTKDVGRYAIVCFVRLGETPVYDKEMNGRLQEFPAGFNFNMPFREFEALFK